MKDKFFEIENCQRCNATLRVRIMSWFTDDTICIPCSIKETEIKRSLPENGKQFEGCGYIPKIEEVL